MKTVKNVIVAILAILGVLFLAILFLPEDEEGNPDEAVTTESAADADIPETEAAGKEDGEHTEEQKEEGDGQTEEQKVEENTQAQSENMKQEDNQDVEQEHTNTVSVNIPEKERTGKNLKFRTMTLDNKEISQEIFSEYDLTLVHVWGTFCGPCVSEMGEYAALYKELPDNVNMVAILCDVYEGMDNSVQDAEDILNENGAEFTNMRISDDVYEIIEDIQYVPSSFFVDSDGCLVGDIMEGIGFEETKKRLEGYLK